MAVSLQTYNEILGKLVRKIIADSPVNDINTGSVLLTLLEAVAAQDFENNSSILSVLETLNIDALKNSDLDTRAADYGLSRIPASKATGFITISDSSIVKRSTTLYGVKPAPIAGATIIYVNDASSWDPTGGTLYIGRGTQQFEGPVTYTSITPNGSFYTINLASALQKDHLSSDTVIDGQGTLDRVVSAGTVVKIPANNLSPEVRFITLRNAVLAAGEDSISNIAIVAENSGANGNAGIGTIIQFSTLPFGSAAVTNTSPVSGGSNIESDEDLRERLKNYSATLSRGTRAAILSAIIGVSDSTDGKQVSSAVVQEPTTYGEPSIIYVDDGSGFQPSTQGQSVDVLLASASGGEQFLQLSNFPVPRPQIMNQNDGPIELSEGMRLVVSVDDVEQEVIFNASDFNNISAATLIEIATAINTQANANNYDFRCRLADSSARILVYPTKFDAEFIQVVSEIPDGLINANTIIGFPTNKYSYISLYKNNTLLRTKETAATLFTLASPWTALTSAGTLILSVDGTPAQTAYFDSTDFNGAPLSSIAPAQWAAVINTKFAGITATATSNGKIQIASNKAGEGSSLAVIGGTYVDDWFSGISITAAGSASDFSLNRQTGNLKLSMPAETGDSITAGNSDAKGYILTAPTNTGAYELSADAAGRPSQMVVAVDGMEVEARGEVSPSVGNNFKTLTNASDPAVPVGVMRIVCDSANTLQGARVGDYVYIAYKAQEVNPVVVSPTWFAQNNTGLFKISAKGKHTINGVNTYVDVVNVGATAEPVSGYYSISATSDVQVFGSDVYPQVWKASYVSDTAPVTLQQMISSLGSDLLNVKGTLFKSNAVKITSTTENNGAISVPVSVGKLSFVVDTAQGSQLGNQSHIATRISSKDMVAWFKRGSYIQRTSTNTILPDRSRYIDVSGTLSSNAVPGSDPLYAENLESSILSTPTVALDDLISINSGSNKSLFRSINNLLTGSIAGTRKGTPYTTFDYRTGDSIELIKSLSFASDDSIVFVLDGDAVSKTINVNFWRTGRVNSLVPAEKSQFSADDADNESGINFGTMSVWSTSSPISTNFNDYAVWFRSRNWYRSGGPASSNGTMIIRAKEYGPIGDSHRFSIDYPSAPNQPASVQHSNNPEYTTTTYYFGSDIKRTTGITGGTLFSVRKLKTIQTTAQGASSGQVSSGDYFYLQNASEKIVFWYDVNAAGTSQPSVPGASRFIKINTVNTGDSAAVVAQKTRIAIDDDESFTATVIGDTISFFNNFNDAPLGTVGQSAGLAFVFNEDTKMCRYSFLGSVNLSSVAVGDVMSIASSTTVTTGNAGTFQVKNVSVTGKYVDVYNPSASATPVGRVDEFTVSGVTAAGTKMVQTITTTAEGAAAGQVSNGDYFLLNDQSGSVVFWYDVNAAGTSQPSVPGASRFIKINTVNTGDSAAVVASKTSAVVGSDTQFTTSYSSGALFTVTNNFVGPVTAGSNGTGILFTFSTITSGAADALGGKYFKMYDSAGSVAVWLNVNGETVPPHGCLRAIQVILAPGDMASIVAAKIAATVDADSEFVANSSTTNVYISNYYNGVRNSAIDGNSPYNTEFTITLTQAGADDTYDASSSDAGLTIFPLLFTDVSSIVDTINTSATLTATAVGSVVATITSATKEELLPVSYGHDTNPANNSNWFVRMYDGSSLVRTFANSNPNFILKTSLILQGEEPTIYDMATCPNPDTIDTGEFFKLIPKTIKNAYHHMTHRALSQLPIVADIDIAGNFRKIQVKSKKLGTQGGVEIVGGRANIGELDLISTASTATNDTSTINYLSLTTQAYPNTLAKGDTIKIYNTLPAKRKFLPDSSVPVEVKNDTLGNVKYYIGSRDFNFSPYTRWTITDVSATYGAASGTVWRWLHNQGGAKAIVKGDVKSYTISSIVRTSGIAYVTLAANHTLLAGQPVVISGVPAFNGTWTILSPGSNTFQFASTGTDTSSAGGVDCKVTSIESQSTNTFTYSENGSLLSSRIRRYDFSAGNEGSPFTVSLTVDTTPTQADYFLITGPQINPPGSTKTFAVWFNVDGNGTTPSDSAGTPYNTASNKIRVDIFSTDTPNQIVSKLSAALTADTVFSTYMISSLESGTDLSKVNPGDSVDVWPSDADTYLVANWPMGNQSQAVGSLKVSGLPVLSVNAASRYMDVLNPNGRAMSSVYTSESGNMSISPSIVTKFRLKHAALNYSKIVVSTNIATVTTDKPHGISIGDTVVISDTGISGLTGNFVITATADASTLRFSTSGVPDNTYYGNCILNGLTETRYKITSLGFKNLFKIECAQGTSPYFADCGVCVDDFVEIAGLTFNANNRGRFRILAVDNNSMIIENVNGVEELNTNRLLNRMGISATWTVGSNLVTGVAGAFSNAVVGGWIRSVDDNDGYFTQISSINNPDPKLATIVTLGQNYRGPSGNSQGIISDFEMDINKGSQLLSTEDLAVYECDSTVIGDSLVIDSLTDPNWFNSTNTGNRQTTEWGTNIEDRRQYVMVTNADGTDQQDVSLLPSIGGMYLLENELALYETIRIVGETAISRSSTNQRLVYATPNDRTYKMSSKYGTKIASLGKMNFPLGSATGVDGYLYYTGLMRTVQRVIDGYEPDSATYPGRRAVGSSIELLPPLIKTVSIVLKITTKDGVNLNDITNDIKSTIISYISSLGVGKDVILSEIIRRVKDITGVETVTFTSPLPSLPSIPVNDNEKALTSPDLISLS